MAISQTRNAGLPLINILRLKGVPILQQLHLEERLLRTSSSNWCIINDGTTRPTIVMGVSGKPKELLETDAVLLDEIPVIRRFTGGGTVIVDQDTIFVTFICNKDAVPSIQPYPQPIMSWSSLIYKNIFQGIGDFGLRENGMIDGPCSHFIIDIDCLQRDGNKSIDSVLLTKTTIYFKFSICSGIYIFMSMKG